MKESPDLVYTIVANFSSSSTNTPGTKCSTLVHTSMPIDLIIYGTLFYILIFVVGFIGNFLVIYVLMKEKEMRTFTNYLLANLSIADLLVLFTCVPTGLHDLFARERWYLGKVACYLIAFIENCMGYASILSIFFITLDRYYVICKPLTVKSIMTQARTLKVVILIWIVSVIANVPFLFLSSYKLAKFYDCTEGYKCYTKLSNLSKYYVFFSYFVIYFLIGMALLFMYYRIFKFLKRSNDFLFSCQRKSDAPSKTKENCVIEGQSLTDEDTRTNKVEILKKSKKNGKIVLARLASDPDLALDEDEANRVNQSITNDTETTKVNNTNNRSSYGEMVFYRKRDNTEETIVINVNNKLGKYVKQRKQIIGMLVALITVFYVCMFPLRIWNLVLILFGDKPWFNKHIRLREYWYISITCRILFYLNSSVNPILYNWFSKKFRRTFRRAIRIPKFFPKFLQFSSTATEHANQNNNNNDNQNINNM
jgi:hypothetical protein